MTARGKATSRAAASPAAGGRCLRGNCVGRELGLGQAAGFIFSGHPEMAWALLVCLKPIAIFLFFST